MFYQKFILTLQMVEILWVRKIMKDINKAIHRVPVIRNRFLPLPGFACINLCGVIFARPEAIVDDEILRHEFIHTLQMREMAFIGFYLWYLAEWLVRLIVQLCSVPLTSPWQWRGHLLSAYRNMLFEQEAYNHAADDAYLQVRKPYAWIRRN